MEAFSALAHGVMVVWSVVYLVAILLVLTIIAVGLILGMD